MIENWDLEDSGSKTDTQSEETFGLRMLGIGTRMLLGLVDFRRATEPCGCQDNMRRIWLGV